MARRRRLLDRGRVGVSRHQQTQLPPPPAQRPTPSQAPAHGQGLGLGLAVMSLGSKPGQAGSSGPQPLFPHTGVLDTFNRADSGSLGANWTRLNPGGAGGYTSTQVGISGNAAYDPDTAGANKASAAWTAATYAANQEAFCTIAVVPGDAFGVCLRCKNVNGIACKYYFVQTTAPTWGINRVDSFSSSTLLTTGATTVANGDKFGGRVYDSGANVVIEIWKLVSGTWTMIGTVTDSSASKITGTGNVGFIVGNANGSSVGRIDDFGGGAS